jgi:pimeloyl-ACP methyl ester carboxylesterase
MTNAPQYVTVGEGTSARQIAVRKRAGSAPGVLWLGGFKSDMQGTKAVALDAWAANACRAFARFDYSGHGESSGDFRDGTIGRWLEESVVVFERCCTGPQILVGSSMGGWIALLLIRELRRRAAEGAALAASVIGVVLIAPAADFTEKLMWEKFPAKVKRQITETGEWLRPSAYDNSPYPITRALIEDGRKHLLFGNLIETGCPVRILQGVKDEDVPWQHASELVAHLAHDDVVLTLVKDGDHRLSRPEDIERLLAAVAEFT